MKCPTCPDTVLVMADRAGIEIDYCPSCRGVWLDRGELDKIIERSAAAAAPAPETAPAARILPADQPQYQPAPMQPQPQQQYPTNSKYHGKHHTKYHDPRGGYAKKKKSSFLGDIFDF